MLQLFQVPSENVDTFCPRVNVIVFFSCEARNQMWTAECIWISISCFSFAECVKLFLLFA